MSAHGDLTSGTARASVDEHAARVRDLVAPALQATGSETVALPEALGRLTSGPVLSPVDLPLFRNAQMDGFAVRASDLTTIPVRLPVIGDQPAGNGDPGALWAGTARRIMTGAIVPDGADCVVPVEDTDARFVPSGSPGGTVTIRAPRAPGDFVRERGSDLRAGGILVPALTRLAPRHLAAVAAAGLEHVEVRRRPRIAVITSGAELVRPSAPAEQLLAPAPGQIYDSNAVALASAIRESGAEVLSTSQVGDRPPELTAALDRAVEAGADLILTSGGISAGAFEVVREVMARHEGRIETVAMQPGGPQATGRYRGVAVLSFPGNPVSTQISFVVFLRPLLRAHAGLDPFPAREARLTRALTSAAGKRQFLRGRWTRTSDGPEPGSDGPPGVEPVSGPGSHLVAAMARAELLLDIPAEVTELPEGASVRVWEL